MWVRMWQYGVLGGGGGEGEGGREKENTTIEICVHIILSDALKYMNIHLPENQCHVKMPFNFFFFLEISSTGSV